MDFGVVGHSLYDPVDVVSRRKHRADVSIGCDAIWDGSFDVTENQKGKQNENIGISRKISHCGEDNLEKYLEF